MNLLDHHLHRLFLDHDCIVVPGLGGFVCNRKPAKYDDSRQELIPPSRSILFNERIVHHDGVLVQSIARKLRISFDEALVQVEAESAALKAEMQGGKTVRIQQVGRLFFGEQGHMMFMPDEEMERILRSFGLKRIPLPLLNAQTEQKPIQPAGRIISMPQANLAENQAPWLRIAAAIAVPVIGGAGMFFADNMGDDAALMSAIPVSIQSYDQAFYQPRFVEEDVPTWESIVEGKATNVEPIEDKIEEPKEALIVSESNAMYMLVAGSFSIESNALNLSAELTRKGFDSEVFRQDNGLHVVTYSTHFNENSARTQLAELRSESSTERAWLKRVGAAH